MKNLENLLLQATDLKSKMREIAIQALESQLTKRQCKIAGKLADKLIDQGWSLDDFFKISRASGRTIARFEGELINRYKQSVVPNTLNASKIAKLKTQVKPKHDLARFFGIEIECIIPMNSEDEYCDDCEDSMCDCIMDRRDESISNKLKTAFKNARLFDIEVKGDGSISDYNGSEESPVEITFTCSINNLEKIDRVCKVLNQMNARVNKSCGLHVHVDMRKRDAETESKRLINALPILRRLVPETRRTNTYCLDNKGKLKHSSRYYAVNFQAMRTHNTVEVRLHSSTTNSSKIKNWILLLNTIVENKALDSKKYTTIAKMITDDALSFFGLDSDLRRFFLKREVVFSNVSINTEQRESNSEAA